MSNPTDAVRDALAVYRLTKLVIDDEITADIRDAVFKRFPPESTKLGYLLTCPWCVSIWAGLGVMALSTYAPKSWRVAGGALAASAATGLIEELKNR